MPRVENDQKKKTSKPINIDMLCVRSQIFFRYQSPICSELSGKLLLYKLAINRRGGFFFGGGGLGQYVYVVQRINLL